MQIETLRLFCDLAELASFSRAAERNMISQSAVSQQIAQLERAYNCQLINRHRKSFGLTPEGQLFFNTCKDIISRYENFQASLAELKNSDKTTIRVAAIYSIGMHSLQPYIKKFISKNPCVHLDIKYLDAAAIYEKLMLGKIDLGLVALPRNNPEMQIIPFMDENLVIVCSPKHKLAEKTHIDIDLIQYYPFIAFARNLPTRNWIDQLLIRYNVAIKPVMEFDNIETIKRVVEINSGISIMPETTIKNEIANGTVKAIAFANQKFVRPPAAIMRKNRAMTKHLNKFIELLTENHVKKP